MYKQMTDFASQCKPKSVDDFSFLFRSVCTFVSCDNTLVYRIIKQQQQLKNYLNQEMCTFDKFETIWLLGMGLANTIFLFAISTTGKQFHTVYRKQNNSFLCDTIYWVNCFSTVCYNSYWMPERVPTVWLEFFFSIFRKQISTMWEIDLIALSLVLLNAIILTEPSTRSHVIQAQAMYINWSKDWQWDHTADGSARAKEKPKENWK